MKKQPKLEVSSKSLIEEDGLQFKDLNGNGRLAPYEDWRLSPAERARDLVTRMDLADKVGMMLIYTSFTGYSQENKDLTSHGGLLDEQDREADGSIFVTRKRWGTSYNIKQLRLRHFILRENPSARDLARWVNAMNEVAEETPLGIPVLIASNSRNEHAEPTFGMNDASGVYSTWPATLGLAAAALGDIKDGGDASLITTFAETAREEWTATGMRKGYMYIVDTVTDPRWRRTYGTFGEDTDFISDVAGRLVDGFQGEALDGDSVALTIKHFPGGGPRENGFDPHYEEGKWNVYPTEGSLDRYHLPPFRVAVEHGVSSIMPYYSCPSIRKSHYQTSDGQDIPFEEVGFAFNHYFLQDILRDRYGFAGYVNSDSGITDNMCWGVEDLSIPERFAKAVNAGTDIIADTNNAEDLKAAVENRWISMERVDEANRRLLEEMFNVGLFDDRTYVDPDKAQEVVAAPERWEKAYEGHQKSVTILKNSSGLLPLTGDKLAGRTVYLEAFHREAEKAERNTKALRKTAQLFDEIKQTEDWKEADIAILTVNPKSGNYFSATPGLLELEICEDKTNQAIDGSTYQETTVTNLEHLREVAGTVRKNGGKVVISLNVSLAWIVGELEPIADAFIAHYETFDQAQLDVITGQFTPVGVLPLTLPASADVIAVDEDGVCVSPNDVPGFDKQQYMPEGLHYAYVDADGNEYLRGHGLRY